MVVGLLRATLQRRGDLIAEHLLLCQQLDVLTRPTRSRPRLRRSDKAFWLLARVVRGDWRRVPVAAIRRYYEDLVEGTVGNRLRGRKPPVPIGRRAGRPRPCALDGGRERMGMRGVPTMGAGAP